MIVSVQVIHVDGTVSSVDTSAVSVVNTERKFDVGIMGLFALPTARIEALYWLGWESLRLSGQPVPPFDTWLRTVATIDVADPDPPTLPPP